MPQNITRPKAGRPPALTTTQTARLADLYRRGLTYEELGNLFDITTSTVERCLHKLKAANVCLEKEYQSSLRPRVPAATGRPSTIDKWKARRLAFMFEQTDLTNLEMAAAVGVTERAVGLFLGRLRSA
jgi:predicted ArsR family transcriptional regulator